jgi:hypothetical protein
MLNVQYPPVPPFDSQKLKASKVQAANAALLFSLTHFQLFQLLLTAMAIHFSRMALQAALMAAATTVMVLNTQVQVVQAMAPNPSP